MLILDKVRLFFISNCYLIGLFVIIRLEIILIRGVISVSGVISVVLYFCRR